jgi:hypothetical protein
MNRIMTVEFRGAELIGFQLGGIIFVAVRPIVEGMGLSWSGQYERIKRSPILNEGVRMIRTPFGPGGPQEMVCLSLQLIHGWLFTIEASRVREELRDRVFSFQRECYEVLFRHFSGESEKLEQQRHESESLRVRMVSEARQTFGARAAAQLWKELELPYVPAMALSLAQPDLFDIAA